MYRRYKGQFSEWQKELPGVDFSAGECTSATGHILAGRRKADIDGFCERLAVCSSKFAKLLAAKTSDGGGGRQSASKPGGSAVSFAAVSFNNESLAVESSAATVFSRSASLADALQAGGAGDIVYASKRVVSPTRKDRDWGKKAWNARPGTTACASESSLRTVGLHKSDNDLGSFAVENHDGRSRRKHSRPRIRKQAWSPSAIVTRVSESESINVGVSVHDSTVSMSRFEQRVYGSDASVAELLC